MNAKQRRKAKRLHDQIFGAHTSYWIEVRVQQSEVGFKASEAWQDIPTEKPKLGLTDGSAISHE